MVYLFIGVVAVSVLVLVLLIRFLWMVPNELRDIRKSIDFLSIGYYHHNELD